jgi:hypothetical protein
MVFNNSRIRATCPVTMTTDPPLFHYDVYLMSEVPLVALLPSCAIGDAACSTHEWQHTLETLGSWRTVPIVFTGYNRSEVMDDWVQNGACRRLCHRASIFFGVCVRSSIQLAIRTILFSPIPPLPWLEGWQPSWFCGSKMLTSSNRWHAISLSSSTIENTITETHLLKLPCYRPCCWFVGFVPWSVEHNSFAGAPKS